MNAITRPASLREAENPVGGNPPGPRYWLPGSLLLQMNRRPLDYLSDLKRRHGDFVRLQAGPVHVFLVSDPELIREVLVTREKSFRKGRGLQLARRVVGDGLLTSEGELHRRQRKLMQPVFHRQRVAGFGQAMVDATRQLSAEWAPGQTVDALQEMHRLALRIVGRTLFDSEVEHHAEAVAGALEDGRRVMALAMFPLVEWAERWLPPLRRRARRSRELLDATLLPLIEEHRARPREDLLSMLIEADMSDEQVRDEALTLFLAGHETTANALAWTLHLLARHPEIQGELQAEARNAAPEQSSASGSPLARFPLAERVLLESLRLYPPAWTIGRMATEDLELGSYPVKKGSMVLTSQYLVHRDERWFPQPEVFDPSRWERCPRASLPRYAYFPFGGGSRVCIGEHFAMLELTLILTTLMRDWTVRPGPGPEPRPRPAITLRPDPAPRLRLETARG